MMSLKETLNKLIPFMVRQAHHERNQLLTVRPELVEGLVQSSLKTILLMLSLLATSLLLKTVYAEPAVSAQSQKQNSSQSVILDMQNMTCALCKFTIKKALQSVEGVEDTNVDYDTKTAKVTFNPQKTSVDTLIKATTDAGYPATVH